MSTTDVEWIEKHEPTARAAEEVIKLTAQLCERLTDAALTATLAD